MNWRRGLLRAWIAFSIIWGLGSGLIWWLAFRGVSVVDDALRTQSQVARGADIDPVFGLDLSKYRQQSQGTGPNLSQHQPGDIDPVTGLDLSKYPRVPQGKGDSTAILDSLPQSQQTPGQRAYQRARLAASGDTDSAVWISGTVVALGPPVVLLVLGLIVWWIVAGFRRP